MTHKFTKTFPNYVCEGDSITTEINDFIITAKIVRDDCGDTPAERDMGFWPSLDPKAAGWIGSDSHEEYLKQLARATSVMAAWKSDEWFYCGIVIKITRLVEVAGRVTEEIVISSNAASLWGIECNYPDSDNSYLTEVANELLEDSLEYAKKVVAALAA